MKLSELILQVGDEHVTLQNIMASSPNLTIGKSCGKVTFDTDNAKVRSLINETIGNKREWVCLAVWIPADKLPST